MSVHSRIIGIAVLIGAAACGGAEEQVPAVQPAAETPGTAISATVPADSNAALPPGLAPVFVDDSDQATADQATDGRSGGTSGRSGSSSATGPGTARDSETAPAAPAAEPEPPAQTPAAQQDKGAEVLRRAAAAYENVRAMQAGFVMHFNNPILRQQTTSRGVLYQQRPDRIALRFTDPDGDVILSDGRHFYVYQPSIDPNQATQTPASAGAAGGVDLQAQFVGNPVERFRYTVEGMEDVGGRPATVMTLVPRTRAQYRSLKVWFDESDALARRFEITEHNGSIRRFDLSELRVNPSIPAEVFRFTPPADVRIVPVG